MLNRIRILLPLAQVAVAASMMTSNVLVRDSLASPAWTKPDWQLCLGLNAPATLIAWYPMHIVLEPGGPRYPFSVVLEFIVRLSLIWLLWYLVSIEIDGKGDSVLTPKIRMRRVVDVLAITFGAMVGVSGVSVGNRILLNYGLNYGRLVAAPYLIWAIVMIGFYGHDLWISFAGKHELVSR